MSIDTASAHSDDQVRSSLGTDAARNLATTTKTVPQTQGTSPRWLLRMLPWVEVASGTYRVNRRLSYVVGDGRVSFTSAGSEVRVIPQELTELAVMRGFADEDVLIAMADRFGQREYAAGDVIVRSGHEADELFLLAHGKVSTIGTGPYGNDSVLGAMADGDHFGEHALTEDGVTWGYTVKALSPCTVLTLSRRSFADLVASSAQLREHVERHAEQRVSGARSPRNKKGEADIAVASGHAGEPPLPSTFVDYETAPREYGLDVAQTVLRVHSRVADLYNDPMDQIEQQLRLTVIALRERQEHELVNNRDFGLLHNADLTQRIQAPTGAPTPDAIDDLLCRRRGTKLFLAHPKAIAAFGRECSTRGIYPGSVDVDGQHLSAWRGVPIFPCDKIPISAGGTTSIMAMRTGEDSQGVVGLRQTGLPDEREPGLNVRFTGVNDKAVISYLVSAYFSAAVLVPDALGVLENVEISRA